MSKIPRKERRQCGKSLLAIARKLSLPYRKTKAGPDRIRKGDK